MFNQTVKVLVLLMLTLTTKVLATTTPLGFIDCGLSTIQLSKKLEWKDVNLTMGRSYDDVLADITDSDEQVSDEFEASEGWRYPTEDEFQSLISEWFSINYFSYSYSDYPFGDRDEKIVEAFIIVFGDTYHTFLDSTDHKFDIAEKGSGAIKGIIGSYKAPINWRHSVAIIHDSEMIYRNGELYEDRTDIVDYSSTQPDNNSVYNVGSFLVRDLE